MEAGAAMIAEWKRFLLSKRILLTFVFLVVTNFLLFSYSSADEEIGQIIKQTRERMALFSDCESQKIEQQLLEVQTVLNLFDYCDLKQEYPSEYTLIYQEKDIALRNANPEISEKFDRGEFNKDEVIRRLAVLETVSGSIAYVSEYREKLEQIQVNADKLSSIGIFQNDDGSAQRNISKTAKDYATLANVEITPGNDVSTVKLLEYGYLPLIGLAFAVILVGVALEEEKHGMRPLIFSCRNGRGALTLWRVGGLIAGSVLFSLVLYGTTMLFAVFLYGPVDIGRSVQSVPELFGIITPMTLGQLWALYLGLGAIVQIMMTVLVWCVFSVIRHRAMAVTLLAGILAGSILLYNFIPNQSVFAVLKYANLAAVLDFAKVLCTYRNVVIGPFLIEKNGLMLTTLAVLLVVAISISVWCGVCRHSIVSHGRLFRGFQFLIDGGKRLYHRIVSRLPFMGMETYKALMIQRGAVVLLAFALILSQTYQVKEPVYAGEAELMHQFYADFGNEGMTENVRKYMDDLNAELAEIEDQWLRASEAYSNGSISAEEYERAFRIYDAYAVQRQAAEQIQSAVDYIEQQETTGYSAVFVEPTAYEYLLDGNDRVINWIACFVVAALCAGVFAVEKKRGLHSVLFSTEKGRLWLAKRKTLLSLILAFFVYALFIGFHVYCIAASYGLPSLDAPAHSLMYFSDCPVNWSIGAVLAIYALNAWLVYAVVAMTACLFSVVISYELSVFAVVAAVVLPEIFNLWSIATLQQKAVSVIVKGDWGALDLMCVVISVMAVMICRMWQRGKRK